MTVALACETTSGAALNATGVLFDGEPPGKPQARRADSAHPRHGYAGCRRRADRQRVRGHHGGPGGGPAPHPEAPNPPRLGRPSRPPPPPHPPPPPPIHTRP